MDSSLVPWQISPLQPPTTHSTPDFLAVLKFKKAHIIAKTKNVTKISLKRRRLMRLKNVQFLKFKFSFAM